MVTQLRKALPGESHCMKRRPPLSDASFRITWVMFSPLQVELFTLQSIPSHFSLIPVGPTMFLGWEAVDWASAVIRELWFITPNSHVISPTHQIGRAHG